MRIKIFGFFCVLFCVIEAQAARFSCLDNNIVEYRLSVKDDRVSRLDWYTQFGSERRSIPIKSQSINDNGDIEFIGQYMDTAYYTFKFTLIEKADGSVKLKVVNHYFKKTLRCVAD